MFKVFKKTILRTLLLLTISFAVTSCGSGGDQYAGGGIGGTGTYAGVITNFGSVEINEETIFNTSIAEFTVDGESATQGNLELGMKVEIEASNSTALTVDFESEVKGPVDIIFSADTFIVMGQTIHVDSATKFKGITDLTVLNPGDKVVVSGFFTGDDEILATYVEFDPSLTEFKVKGEVEELNTISRTFEINDLMVDYSGVTNPPIFQDDDFVEVKGVLSGAFFVATALELETYLPLAIPGYDMEIQGIITVVTSQNDFEVNGQRIFITPQTLFENGSSVNIVRNARVEVEGTVDENSILIADEVEFE